MPRCNIGLNLNVSGNGTLAAQKHYTKSNYVSLITLNPFGHGFIGLWKLYSLVYTTLSAVILDPTYSISYNW